MVPLSSWLEPVVRPTADRDACMYTVGSPDYLHHSRQHTLATIKNILLREFLATAFTIFDQGEP